MQGVANRITGEDAQGENGAAMRLFCTTACSCREQNAAHFCHKFLEQKQQVDAS